MLSKYKNITIILLISVFLFSIFACSDTKNTPISKSELDTKNITSKSDTTSVKFKLDLPDALDFGGVDFNILACDESVPYTYIEIPEQDGDILNDSIYERNMSVEEKLNVKLKLTTVNGTDTEPLVRASVLSGDQAYDLVSPHILRSISTLVVQNLIQDFNDVPHIDFNKPWWNQDFSTTMQIKGKIYYASGDIIAPNARVVIFNKEMMENHGKDDIYQLINDGKWTLDKLGDYVKDVISDLNGDGVYDANDQYAFSDLTNTGLATSFVHASNMRFLEVTDEGFRLTFGESKMDTIINKLYDYLYRDGNVYKTTNEEFGNGKVLFGSQVLLKLQILRDYDTDFGIIPFPKYDEIQENYYSSVWNGLLCIPFDVKDIECTGAVLEAMNYYSSLTLMPTYHKKLLDSKFVRDEESSRMLDIIFDGLIYDFGLCFDNFMGNYASIGKLLNEGKTDIASFFAANENIYTAHYTEIFESVQ